MRPRDVQLVSVRVNGHLIHTEEQLVDRIERREEWRHAYLTRRRVVIKSADPTLVADEQAIPGRADHARDTRAGQLTTVYRCETRHGEGHDLARARGGPRYDHA